MEGDNLGKDRKECKGCEGKIFDKKKENYVCLRIKKSKNTFDVHYFHNSECFLKYMKTKLCSK